VGGRFIVTAWDELRLHPRSNLACPDLKNNWGNMTAITIDKPTTTATQPSSAFTNFVLGQIRCAELRARIAANQLKATAVALSGGLIGAEAAIAMLHEAGLLPLDEASS
jgi:hypothetical protein